MKVVKVYGELKERLGGQGTFELDVFNPAEAIKALCANFPGLDKWFIDSGEDGIVYKVLLGERELNEDTVENFFYPWSEKEVFHITPVLIGSGGVGRFFAGVALIAVGVATGGAGFALFSKAGWAAAGFMTKAMVGMGAMLALGGISSMLTPVPKQPEEAKRLQSFSFSGIQQTSMQGGPVPIVYGKCFIGSAVLSAGLDTYDE